MHLRSTRRRVAWRGVVGAVGTGVALVAAPAPASDDSPLEADRWEPGVLPVLAGDTDVGFKFGGFVQLARFRDDIKPYAWRGQAMAATSVMDGASGTEFPYREVFFRLDVPRVFEVDDLRVIVDGSYLRTTNRGYYGLGNDAAAERKWAGMDEGSDAYVAARRHYQYDATTPQVRITALWRVAPEWRWYGDAALRAARIETYPTSHLAADVASEEHSLHGTGEYVEPVLAAGVVFDTRDHETATTSGQWHELSARCTPAAWGTDPYCGANLTLRGYVPLAREQLSIAARVLGDVVTQRAPLLELSRYGGMAGGPSVGGARGIRGVPQGRLHGRTKLLGNVELRSLLVPFRIASQRFTLGAAAFVDAGRVWTDPFAADPSLDGSGVGMHWGVGGGPRLRWGDALILRFDFAHAPLGSEIGTPMALYVDVVQVM